MIAYEKQLDADLNWALKEGSLHFEEDSAVHKTLRAITKRLDDLGIPASGISAAHRVKDVADVQELIRALKLSRNVAEQLDESVRAKYLELWTAIDQAPPES